MNQSKANDLQKGEQESRSIKAKSVWLNIFFASVIVLFMAKVAQVVDCSCEAASTSSLVCNVVNTISF